MGSSRYKDRDSVNRYITRLGNGWTVRVPIRETNGTDYNRFLDSNYGSSEDALSAARQYRDKQAKLYKADKLTIKKKKGNSKFKDLPTGVIQLRRVKHNSNGRTYISNVIQATHPFGLTTRTFAFRDVLKTPRDRTRDEAKKLAISQRRKWEKEISKEK